MIEKTELMRKYESETGKNSVWNGRITKQFKKWKEKSSNKKEKNKPDWW